MSQMVLEDDNFAKYGRGVFRVFLGVSGGLLGSLRVSWGLLGGCTGV